MNINKVTVKAEKVGKLNYESVYRLEESGKLCVEKDYGWLVKMSEEEKDKFLKENPEAKHE